MGQKSLKAPLHNIKMAPKYIPYIYIPRKQFCLTLLFVMNYAYKNSKKVSQKYFKKAKQQEILTEAPTILSDFAYIVNIFSEPGLR